MRAFWFCFAVLGLAAACGTNETPSVDGGADAPQSGTCCVRGTPTVGMCGPVGAGGYSAFGNGGCKTQIIAPCRHVRADTDEHGCAIWVDDGPCDCDAGAVCPTDASELPLDVSFYSPETIHAPRAAANACTMQQIADFASCWTGDASKCAAFDPDASSCAACLVSQDADASWGPLVLEGTTPTWNSAGCIDLVIGQVSSEPNSCGQKSHDAQGCFDAACNACTPFTEDESTCDELAAQSVCKSYADASAAACAPFADAGASVGASCLPDASIADPVQQERDFITRLASFFCGPP